MSTEPGTLYLVGTPIGNLEDVTLRALRVLREVDVIAAEDTRVTRRLLQRHGIEGSLFSYHQHSGEKRLGRVLQMLREGKRIALVSDAGMPGISDPGARLVRACAEAEVPMVVVPGPTAVSAALALSGLLAREFLFLGFLPGRTGERRKALRRAAQQPSVIVWYEAPHRLRESLEDARAVLGDRRGVCARELTKQFEEVVRGRLSDLIAHFSEKQPRGEMTVAVEGTRASLSEADLAEAVEEVRELVEVGLSQSRAVAHVARRRGVPRGRLYRAVLGAGEEQA
jgi:16S rRNA (cytidine1402-2'-O)-methyltransferase